MSTPVTFNGVSYIIPAIGDASWGTNVSNYLVAIASGALQKTGGSFTLSADVDFGASFGIKSLYLKSETASIAATGFVRMAVTDSLVWRNNANAADLALAVNATDGLTFAGATIADSSSSQTFTNKLFSDATCAFVNALDITKVLGFSLGGATTGTKMTFVSSHTANRSITFPDITDTVVTLTASQTLTNKTHDNSNVYTTKVANATFQDGTDVTKQFKFIASAITTGTTQSVTIPNASGTLVMVSATQSIQNKTLDNTNAYTIKTSNFTMQDSTDTTKQFNFNASAISTSSFRSITIPDTSGTLVLLTNQQTITSKILSDGTVLFGNSADTTKALGFSLGGATTSTKMTIASSHTANRTITIPDVTDTLAVIGSAQTFTNKTFTAPNITGGSFINFLAQAAARFNDSSTNYVAMQAPSSVTTYTITLPNAVPGAGQVLADAGAGNGVMTWASPASSSLVATGVDIGNASNTRTATRTDILGDIKGTTNSQTYAVTSATPGVFTVTAHGFLTGDKVYLTVTQNGFTANTTYWVNKTGANTFTLCSSLANSVAGTGLASSGTTAGIVISGGFVLTSGVKGVIDGSAAIAGYVGQIIQSTFSSVNYNSSGVFGNMTSITLPAGNWSICAAAVTRGNSTTFVSNPSEMSIGSTSSTGGTTYGIDRAVYVAPSITSSGEVLYYALPADGVSISTTTTYYLNMYCIYSGSTPNGSGIIKATRN